MTQESVLEALKNVIYPGFTKDIVTFGFIKEVKIEANSVAVVVDITSSAVEVRDELVKSIDIELRKIGATISR